MEPTNYIFVFFASLLGYLLGIGLGYIAPEELGPGKKYLKWLEKGFFVLTFLPIVYFFGDVLWILLIVLVISVLLLVDFRYRAYAAFGVFLFWFFLIRADNLVVILEASAIFLYGFPAGSLLLSPATVAKLNKKIKVKR